MLVLLLLGFVLIIALEVPAMVMKGQVRELRVFWVLLAVGFILSAGLVLRWPMPSPTPVLEAMFRPFSEALGLK